MGGAKGARRRTAAPTDDGRVLRGARNHEAIVEAVYALVRATGRPPSVDEVAKKAGVGARTVFRQFDDLDTLFRGLAERVEREVFALVTPAPLSGDLHQDLAALIERRKKIYEHITPFRHASRQMRQTSPFIRERDAALAHAFRSILEAIVVPHLPGEAATTIEMLDVLLSFETWDRLRQVQKQSVEQTEAIVLEASKTLTDQARRRQAKP